MCATLRVKNCCDPWNATLLCVSNKTCETLSLENNCDPSVALSEWRRSQKWGQMLCRDTLQFFPHMGSRKMQKTDFEQKTLNQNKQILIHHYQFSETKENQKKVLLLELFVVAKLRPPLELLAMKHLNSPAWRQLWWWWHSRRWRCPRAPRQPCCCAWTCWSSSATSPDTSAPPPSRPQTSSLWLSQIWKFIFRCKQSSNPRMLNSNKVWMRQETFSDSYWIHKPTPLGLAS